MPSPDIVAAAARLEANCEFFGDNPCYRQMVADIRLLLSEIRSPPDAERQRLHGDDGELVTTEWLQVVLPSTWKTPDGVSGFRHKGTLGVSLSWSDHGCVGMDFSVSVGGMDFEYRKVDRESFRLLVKVLGVPLKEPARHAATELVLKGGESDG